MGMLYWYRDINLVIRHGVQLLYNPEQHGYWVIHFLNYQSLVPRTRGNQSAVSGKASMTNRTTN